MLSPARRYNERALTTGETALSDNIIFRNHLADAGTLLTFNDRYVFSAKEVLKLRRKPKCKLVTKGVAGGHASE